MSLRSFLRGFGSVLNIFGSSNQQPPDVIRRTGVMNYDEARKADAEALRSDWAKVVDNKKRKNL